MTKPGQIFEIVRKSLEAGQAVEIEGLGRFHASAGGYRFDPEAQPTVFVAYAVEGPGGGPAAVRGATRGGVLAMAGQGPADAGPELDAIDRGGDCRCRRICSLFFSTVGHQTGTIPERIAPRDRLRAKEASGRRVPAPGEAGVLRRARQDRRWWQNVDLFPDWERGVKRLVRSIRSAARGRMRKRFWPG